MRFALAWFVMSVCVVSSRAAVAATNVWQPPGIVATADTLDVALAKMRGADARAGRPSGGRVEHYRVDANGFRIDAAAKVRDADYALVASFGNESIAFGRNDGERWRASAAGTVHLIRADVQGDYVDRWPVSALGFDAADCTLAGIATIPERAWVIADKPALDIPRWFYVDTATGDVVREVSREGGRVETYTFDDVRGEPGRRRAYRWSVSGPGGIADVTLLDSTQANVSVADVAVPPQSAPVFPPPAGPKRLSAHITRYGAILVDVRVDGKVRKFQIDSGTPELILSDAMSRATGTIVAGHGIAGTIDVDGEVARGAPFLDVDFNLDGLLGFDFFRGRIVHVDYAKDTVDVLPRDGFVPPAGAFALSTDWSEGMPIANVRIGDVTGGRFVLDLGSPQLVLRHAFVERAGAAAGIDYSGARESTIHYLEGPFSVRSAQVGAVAFGGIKIDGAPAEVEIPSADNMDFPIDGIIGTEELSLCEWWFDADGPTTWFLPRR